MINTQCNYVRTATLDQAWREVMWLCVMNGEDYLVEKGSYEGQLRKQLPFVTIDVKVPKTRPLSPILPPSIPAPTSDEKIWNYFSTYIFSPTLKPNEVYTYGQFIQLQLPHIIDLLISSKGCTNQATITIGSPDTTLLSDPPCLRSISFKVYNNHLQMHVYFRSWDLYAGLPENLGGLQLLKEWVLECLNTDGHLNLFDGPIVAQSDGLHIYDQYFDIVDSLNVDKIKVGARAMKAKEEYLQLHGG